MPQDPRALFNQATALHRQGRYDEAIEGYRRLAQVQPGRLELLRLLTFAQLQAGYTKDAQVTARHATDTHPASPEACMLMGAVLQVGRDWEGALATYEAAQKLDPVCSEAFYLAGKAHAACGRNEKAVQNYSQTLTLDTAAVDARIHRARALARLGRHEEALEDCEALLIRQPDDVRHLVLKAQLLVEFGQYEQAAHVADVALEMAPRSCEAHLLRGQGLQGQGRLEEARIAFNAALACSPQRHDIHARLAGLELRRQQPERAAAICDTALALAPECIDVLYERAEARRELGHVKGALADVEAVLAHLPHEAPALTLKARLMADLGNADQFRACLDAACAADPSASLPIYLRATDQLARGFWREGWAGYESRTSLIPSPYEALAFERWDGQGTPEELIVVGESNLSDLLLFSRLLRTLCDRAIPARLLTDPRHAALLGRVDARVPVIHDLAQIGPPKAGTRWVPVGSLPGLLSPDPADWPRPPYLPADPERVVRWRHIEEDAPRLFRIGICWQDDSASSTDTSHFIPLEAFEPLACMEGVCLVSLQLGAGADLLNRASFADKVLRLDERRDRDGTFVDTSGILQHLDLIVTGDTALCHLAGARGRPTFAALRTVPDWCWGREGDVSPLYPTMQLFRQTQAGEWADVFQRIVHAIRNRQSERREIEDALFQPSDSL